MASKFRESPHSRSRGLQIPPHLHLGESGQSGLERETRVVCLVISLSGDGFGRPATRAKALNCYTGYFRGFKNPLPRTKVRGWHQGLARAKLWPVRLLLHRRMTPINATFSSGNPGQRSLFPYSPLPAIRALPLVIPTGAQRSGGSAVASDKRQIG